MNANELQFERRLGLLTLGLALAVLGGCGDGSAKQAVTGTVTLNGKPLEKGQIVFRPERGTSSPSAGADISKGGFSITCERGVLPGKFRVEITASRPSGKRVRAPLTGETINVEEQFLPARYNLQSELKAAVESGGSNRFQFELTAK